MKTNQYKVRTVTCAGCGQTVTKRMPDGRRFCSHQCYRDAPRPERKTGADIACQQCGSVFYASNARIKANARFCSVACTDTWQSRHKDAYQCKTCSKEFRWSPSRKVHDNPTYCSIACRDADPSRTEMLIRMNADQAKLQTNSLERAGYEMLDRLGITHERQHLIGGKFCVDAFVPSLGIVIQFDGDYWHGHPVKFPEPDARQRRRMKLDLSQDAYMTACGYRVVRIWECDIKQQLQQVETGLLAALQPSVPQPA